MREKGREGERDGEREGRKTYLASHSSLLPSSIPLATASSISTMALCIYPPSSSSPPSSLPSSLLCHRRWRQESMTWA